MIECIRCGCVIQGAFFKGSSGCLCKKCLKDMQVYYALQNMGLIEKTEEETK